MRKPTLVGGLAVALASMVLVLPPPSPVAAQTGDGEVYSDLVVALRDVNGVPVPSETFWEGVVPDVVEVRCVQPISYTMVPGVTSVLNPVDQRMVYPIPLVGEGSTETTPVEEDTACEAQTEFASYVSEVELERLNLVRTSDEVLWRKLTEVGIRLAGATEITLDGAGRITTDGVAIDASPELAAIYGATEGDSPAPPPEADGRPGVGEPGGLMDTGTIPHWTPGDIVPEYPVDDPAEILQGTGGFDNWMLAASAIGTAASKFQPISIDVIPYYNRISAPTGGPVAWDYVSTSVGVLDQTVGGEPTIAGEEFIDYSTFSYTRSEVFQGCTTWLDVPTLTWKSAPVLDRVEFIDLVDFDAQAVPGTVDNVAGFAQLADDVRSMILYLHENEVVQGFFLDPVFTETCEEQAEEVVRLNQPVDAVDPTVAITVAPAAETTSTTATFEFTSADAASVLCVLDSGAIERCASPKTYTDLEPGTHTFNVIAMGVAGNFVSDTHTWTIIPPGEDSMIVSLDPVRFADTRPGWVAADGLFFGTGPVPARGTIQVPVAGRGGVPADAKAVVANVTVVGATIPGFVTVFPCGTLPGTSSVNYLAGEAVANEVIAKLSPVGSICVYAHSAVNVIVDVAGHL